MYPITLNLKNFGKEGVALMSSTIKGGFPSPAADYIENNIDMNELLIKHPVSTFLIRVEGESMIDSFIPPKALLVVDKSLTPNNGDIIVAVLNGDFTVKKFIRQKDSIFLYPANTKYKPIKIDTDMEFVVWGVVTNIIIETKDVKNACSR